MEYRKIPLLDEELLNRLAQLNLNILIKLDIKDYDEKIHKEYTGRTKLKSS